METPLFSAEQIKIPPELPEILKNYAKFVIKNHPENIYEASAEYPRLTRYFTKLATQSRQTVDAKLNVEQLTTFFKRFQASKPIVSHKDIEDACQWADVATSQIQDTFALGSWSGDQIPWISFWSFLLASVAGNLQDTLLLGVQIAAEQERIKLNIFKNLFEFLVSTDQQAPPHVVAAIKEFLSSSQGIDLESDTLAMIVKDSFLLPIPDSEGQDQKMEESVQDSIQEEPEEIQVTEEPSEPAEPQEPQEPVQDEVMQ